MIHQEEINDLFKNTPFQCTDFKIELESKEYDACQFKINGQDIHYRKAKITPKKAGLFVTFWKRVPSGIIAPFEEKDPLSYLVIAVANETDSGYFIFSKNTLLKQNIISSNLKEGKRAFRIYPPWSIPKNKQAITSQKWQLLHFSEELEKSVLLS